MNYPQRMTPVFLLTPLLLVGCEDVQQGSKVYRSPYPDPALGAQMLPSEPADRGSP